jgi:hypothetical protein
MVLLKAQKVSVNFNQMTLHTNYRKRTTT